MPIKLRLGIIVVAIILLLIILVILRKGRMPVKYSLIWILSSLIIFLLGLVPELFSLISHLIGFITISNMITGVFIFILLMICVLLTVMISGQKKKATLLIQEISMLKERINKLENK